MPVYVAASLPGRSFAIAELAVPTAAAQVASPPETQAVMRSVKPMSLPPMLIET